MILPGTEPRTGALRLLAWVDRYPPFPGAMAGGEWALHGMLSAMAARGHVVQVCAPCAPDGRTTWLDGVQIEGEALAPALLDDCDVLVSHLLWTKHAVNAATRGGTPLVYLFHNDFTIPHWRLTTDNVTAVVYNTHWLEASILHKHAHWADVPAIVVRPPVHLDAYRVDDPPGWDRPHVTLVNPNVEKGSGMLYKLAEARRDLTFLAVEGAYGHQVRPLRRHRNVEWQRQTPAMRDDVYARTRILLVPSKYESFGRVAIEAAASGAAVIASSTPGLHEALGAHGLFANLANPREWLSWLDALGDRDIYETAVRAGIERAAQLARESAVELDALENLFRLSANAEAVPSRLMAPAYDPRRTRRHARSVDVSGPAESPAPDPEALAAEEAAAEAELQAAAVAAIVASNEELARAAGHPTDAELLAAQVGGTVVETTEHHAVIDVAGTDLEAAVAEGLASGEIEVDPADLEPPAEPEPVDPDRPALADEVPPNAVDVAEWIKAGADEAAVYDRAEAAEYVELRRQGKRRKTVMDAVGPVLYLDD